MSSVFDGLLPLGRRAVGQKSILSLTSPTRARVRWQSSSVSLPAEYGHLRPDSSMNGVTPQYCSPITRLSTWSLMRTVLLSVFLTKPLLFKPGLWTMQKIANSESRLLNPDRNPLLKAMIKPLVYDHFCGGTHRAEIQKNIQTIKDLGFSGVILCYVREIQVSKDNKLLGAKCNRDEEVELWRKGTLETVEMLDSGNWMGLKMTGAGQGVTEALLRGDEAPPAFVAAMDEACRLAKARNVRIWVDSEQQAVQPTIDKWTIPFMRKYNRDSQVLVHNTVQAYLKQSRHKLRYQLELAQKEGWTLGVKLVRGAYIAHDDRTLIHDTKADTDASYDGIVHDLLTGRFDGFTPETFPNMRLFLAGHNPDSIRKAITLSQQLSSTGRLKVRPEFGQLQGMADDLGCEIISVGEQAEMTQQGQCKSQTVPQETFIPRAYKCVHWGTVQECMQYLVRRAVENAAAVGRIKDGAAQARSELLRRATPRFLRRQSSA